MLALVPVVKWTDNDERITITPHSSEQARDGHMAATPGNADSPFAGEQQIAKPAEKEIRTHSDRYT
jgi:hypothetical protein